MDNRTTRHQRGFSCVGINCLLIPTKILFFFYPFFKPLKVLFNLNYTPVLNAKN